MKRITFSRKQILRAIHAACVALFFAVCAGHAHATNAPFVQSGTTVTTPDAIGLYSPTSFTTGSSNYTVIISPESGQTASLYNTDSVVSIGTGGTITVASGILVENTGSDNAVLVIDGSGSVINSGSIYNTTNGDGVDIFGNGTVTNSGSISSSSNNGIYIDGGGKVTNSGSISGTYGVNIQDGYTNSNAISVSNTGTGSIYGSGDSALYAYNYTDSDFTGNLSNTITITNSGSAYIYGNAEYGVNAENQTYDLAGNVTSTISITNSSYGTSQDNYNGIFGDAVGIYAENDTEGITGNSSNIISVTNSGSVYGNDHGAALYNYNEGITGNASNTTTLSNNYGELGSDDGSAAHIYNDNAYIGGNASNAIVVTNTGSLYTKDDDANGLHLANNSYMVDGNSSNSISLTNTGYNDGPDSGISGGEDGVYAHNNSASTYGNASNSITLNNNTSSIYGNEEYGADLTNHSYNTEGNTANTITVTNSGFYGSIYGYEGGVHATNDTYTGRDFTSGNITNAIHITNSAYTYDEYGPYSFGILGGYLFAPPEPEDEDADAVYAENDNRVSEDDGETGNATNIITFDNANSGSGYTEILGEDHGAALYNYNYGIGGNASNIIAVNNASYYSGIFSFLGSALHLENKNEDTGGNASNSIELNNAGYIASDFFGDGGESNGIHLSNDNAFTEGNASNSIVVSNSGYIYGFGDGIEARNNNYYTEEGTATNSIAVYNTGSVYGEEGDGLYLRNHDWDSYSGGSASTLVVNSSAGTIYGGEDGIYIKNSSYTGNVSAQVINAGTIGEIYEDDKEEFSEVGVYFDSANSSLLTDGGEIAGDEYSAYLADSNSSVTILGRTIVTNTMEGNAPGNEYGNGPTTSGNVLNLDLVGLTPTQLAGLKAAVLASSNGSASSYQVAPGYTYYWDGFTTINDNAISLEQVVDPGLVGAGKAIDDNPLPAYTGGGSAGALFDLFYADAFGNAEAAMNELLGREINQGIDTLGVSLNTTLVSDLNQHLDNLLSGDQIGGVDLGGIHVSEAGSMMAFSDTSSQLNSLVRTAGTSAFGGTEMSTDAKEVVAVAPAQPKWGIWASGNVTLANESGTSSLSAFHSTLGSPTLGLDYRVTPNLVLGILGNYTTGSANFDDGSKIGLNAEIAALYGTWRDGNWHVHGIAGGGSLQLNDTRTTFGGETASSTPRGDDIVTDWTGGYDFHLGDGWNITPQVGLQYTHLDVDSFTENGAGPLDLSEGDQNIDSLRSHVGFNLDKSFKLGPDLTFVPEVRALWYHEFMDNSRGISESLEGAPATGSFDVGTYGPQRDFALVGVGLNTAFTGYKGVPVGLFINYNAQVGQNDYIANSVNAGIRVDF